MTDVVDVLERCTMCRGYRLLPSRCRGRHLTYYQALRVKLQRTGDPWDLGLWLERVAAERQEARTNG